MLLETSQQMLWSWHAARTCPAEASWQLKAAGSSTGWAKAASKACMPASARQWPTSWMCRQQLLACSHLVDELPPVGVLHVQHLDPQLVVGAVHDVARLQLEHAVAVGAVDQRVVATAPAGGKAADGRKLAGAARAGSMHAWGLAAMEDSGQHLPVHGSTGCTGMSRGFAQQIVQTLSAFYGQILNEAILTQPAAQPHLL